MCWDKNKYEFSRDDAQLWEFYLLVDNDFIDKIFYIKQNQWISKRNSKLYKPNDIEIHEGFILQIGDFLINLQYLNNDDIKFNYFIGICNHWQPEEFFLYRPLIYITAFSNEDIFKQLELCIESLRLFGDYTGKIIVMTDKSQDFILNLCQENSYNLTVDPMYPKDFVGYVCSKFNIYNKDIYQNHQPILYLDPDIIIDKPIKPMLIEATLTQLICAPLELGHYLYNHTAIGCGLIQQDQLKISHYVPGFNGGTLVIPNVYNDMVKNAIYLIKKTITNTGYFFGRDYNRWADQEVLNYISVKLGFFNTSILTKYVNYIDNNINNRRGLVHFWGHPTQDKPIVMKKYLNSLKQVIK